MELTNKAAKRYLRQVRAWIPVGGQMKRQILDMVQSNLQEYLEECPDAQWNDLVRRFGTPQQIASAQVEEMEAGELLQNLRIRRRVVTIAVCTALAVVLMWASMVSAAYLEFGRGIENLTVTEGIIVEEDVTREE